MYEENHGSLFWKKSVVFGSCSDFSAPGSSSSKAMDVLCWIVFRVHLLVGNLPGNSIKLCYRALSDDPSSMPFLAGRPVNAKAGEGVVRSRPGVVAGVLSVGRGSTYKWGYKL